MLLLLMTLRPHVFDYTFWVDVVCYTCLSAQFGLQTILASIDFFAVVPSTDQERTLIRTIRKLIQMFRYLPVAVLAIVLLNQKIYIGNAIRTVARRAIALLRRAKRRILQRQQPHDGQEMQSQHPADDSNVLVKFN